MWIKLSCCAEGYYARSGDVNISDRVTRNPLNRRLDMKRYPRILALALFVFSATAIDNYAQSSRAKAHWEAARAAAYEPGQDFTGAFGAVCVKPQPLAAQPPVF